MIDYLNPHHVYIDTQTAPDLSVEVKRDECDLSAEFRRDWMAMMQEGGANIIPEMVDTLHNPARTDAKEIEMNTKDYLDICKQITDGIREGLGIVSPSLEMMGGEHTRVFCGLMAGEKADRIIRLYRSGMSHVDIAGRGFDLADVRRVISEATRKDERLYRAHKEGQ